jgi:hypothetical protein
MNLENGVLHAKSTPEWYALEQRGDKPNTLRVVDDEEFAMCKKAHTISIHHEEWHFERPIAGVYDVTGVLWQLDDFSLRDGQHLVLICWGATR